MGFYECLWFSGCLWVSMGIYGCLAEPIGFMGF